jgi:hypothetical protein
VTQGGDHAGKLPLRFDPRHSAYQPYYSWHMV